ncbi:MAG TPA: hypothetical protein VGY54_11910 [Polyangiaceae bacterium]|jgi:hypothetical protein|nr:hypothetical protein [Polyangiaceae bacterium]
MIPLIPPRLHGWLDEAVPPIYVAIALLIPLHGVALALLVYCALQHFAATRITDSPRGSWPLISFPMHARFDLLEGLLLIAGAYFLAGETITARATLATLGVLQVGAFALSDTRWPEVRSTQFPDLSR